MCVGMYLHNVKTDKNDINQHIFCLSISLFKTQ